MSSVNRTAEALHTNPAAGAAPAVRDISRRGLAGPALLFLAGHRPLAYAAGNLLAVAAPVAAVLGAAQIGRWAHLLIAPGGVESLIAALQTAEQHAEERGR
jgi:hypothetical protein